MIQAMAQLLIERHGGQVPADMTALTALPGVGRKTANVVLGHTLGVPGLPVDLHVMRVANRLAIAQAATPEQVESQLCAVLPPERWTLASDTMILHGRRICRPRPALPRLRRRRAVPVRGVDGQPGAGEAEGHRDGRGPSAAQVASGAQAQARHRAAPKAKRAARR
jgi:hypothetical protein